jgi:uncharacterized protein (UPF0548 family)
VFKLGRVSESTLLEIARRAESLQPTYDFVGAAITGSPPAGFHHDVEEVQLPDRPDAFERGADGLRQWAAHRGAGLSVEPHEQPALNATVAVGAPLGPMTAVAVCRIVTVVDEADWYGFAYGTLPGHPEQGEEAFVVERVDDRAVFRVVAFSRPFELLARAGGPISRRIQRSTTRRYLNGLVAYVSA